MDGARSLTDEMLDVSRSDIVLPFISHDGLKRTNPSQQKPTTSL
jgi:hypothetical protein